MFSSVCPSVCVCSGFYCDAETSFMVWLMIISWSSLSVKATGSRSQRGKWLLFHFHLIGLSIERPILDHHAKAHIHEIRRISWNPANFTPWNPAGFHEIREIRQISWNPWNPADFTLKSGGFHEIQQISWNPWNPADFTLEIRRISPRYHLSNPSKIIKASVSAKTLQFWWMQGGGYDQGFHEIHPEIWWISPRYHLWNPPKL